MTVDLTGVAVMEIRAYPPVAAITPRVRGAELAPGDAPPAVVVRKLGISYAPFGRGSRRLGLQEPMFAALCFGATYPQAAQLAGAVVDAINLRGPRSDSAGRAVLLSLVEGGGNPTLDPDTKWVTETVTFTFVGAAQAVPIGA